MIKTFRGILADGGQDRIRLQTIKGKVGYKITKFELFANTPGSTAIEAVYKIFKTKQTTITAIVDFTNSDLLAAAYLAHYNQAYYGSDKFTIFDNEVFNQDIYLTYVNVLEQVASCNYYLELDVIPLDDAGAEYTTLKDMRQS